MDLPALLASSPILFITLAVILGLLVGSFLNVVIYRLPLMMEREWQTQCAELLGNTAPPAHDQPIFNLWTPRSQCPNCGHLIRAHENIPLFSYLLQRGRCAHCDVAISIQYPLVEAASGILAGIVAWKFGFGWPAAAALLLTWTLLAASVIDFHHQLLPDTLTLPLLWAGLGAALLGCFTDLHSAVVGAMVGYLSLWLVYQAFRLLTNKEGMGYGDFKLLAALGAWTGWQYLLTIIILSSLVGAVFGLTLILLRGRDRSIPMPFGPFLATAGWITLLWGGAINRAYLHGLGL
ncbi:MAG: A24 family peptidase [Candidatus Competibacteraceae bacterium]